MKKILLLVSILLASGCMITGMDSAASAGDVATVQEMLDKGVDVNVKFGNGATPLHNAAFYGHKDVVELLLAHGADVNAESEIGATPLHNAASNGHKDVVELLLAHGVDINARANNGSTSLHNAASNGHKDIVELLLAHGADINARANNGCTVLHNAAFYGHKDVAELLLVYGADVNAESATGATPLRNATANGHKDVAELLRQHGGICMSEANAVTLVTGSVALYDSGNVRFVDRGKRVFCAGEPIGLYAIVAGHAGQTATFTWGRKQTPLTNHNVIMTEDQENPPNHETPYKIFGKRFTMKHNPTKPEKELSDAGEEWVATFRIGNYCGQLEIRIVP